MEKNLIATASENIHAPISKVWEALVDPALIKQYFFGSDVISDWSVGSSILWRGTWEGKPYEDKGMVLQNEQNRVLQYTHWSPLSNKPDAPEHYHTVTIRLSRKGKYTMVSLAQDNNETEQARLHSQKNWKMVLDGLKKLLEK